MEGLFSITKAKYLPKKSPGGNTMTQTIKSEPRPVYIVPTPRVPDIRPSPRIEPVVNQLKSAIVEAYKMDGRRVKVVVVEKS